ncbi:crotonase [Primorskyibacter flagellatus]|uniref:Crotonase n=1 Tax=Primorskyibacter flagellatus TaxID=1387277 RepID=A0A917AEU5_9RHOB|nr:enoyl-CoA hydratase-related protein [Primorskyibacter flagellatus]GGE46109.1 crotonase [Primorskyibacter flagellatus]
MSVQFDITDGIATVTLNRPEAMNSLDPASKDELREIWQRLATDDEIRVAILTGTGEKAFCTGSDLKKTPPPEESFAQLFFGMASRDHLLAGMEFDTPIIAAVNGYAMGGGLELALACDIRIASENARFGLSEVRVGSLPGAGGSQRLPRAIGQSDAMLMMLTGDPVDAAEALRMGLVSRVVAPDKLLEEAHRIAGRIAANAPLSVKAIKRLVRDGSEMPLIAAVNYERLAWGALRDSEDRLEGRKAFQEKRPPVYRGR